MNNKNKILTLTGQKHDYKHLSQIISESSPEELSSILSVLGIDRVVDPDGNIIPVYSLDIESDKPTFITKGFDRVLTGKVYNYFQDVTEKVSSFQWKRDSGDPTRDKAWEVGKTDSTLTLTEEDFTQAIYTKDVIFTLEVVIAGKTLTDSITFSTFQTFSKVQIESSATLFIENSPNNITFTYTSESEISSQKWYVNGNMRGVGKSLVLGYNDVERGKSAVVKLEALEKGTGNVLTDIVSIPRVKNGTDGEQGIPGIPGTSTYTWIKYADTETGEGMSDYPFNRDGSPKEYIGVKANQTNPIESENPLDYEWVKYIGDKGIPGATGYMWIKYSMFPNGRDTNGTVDMYDTPFIIQGPGDREDMSYMGVAYNKETEQESNIPEDYQWSKIRGEDGRTSYLLELSNDNTSVVSDSSGNFPNPGIAFANAKTEATLYYGNEPLERSEYGIMLSSSPGLTYSHSDSNHSVQITGLTTQTGTVTFKAFVKNDNGELDLSKKIAENTFSVTKIANTTVYEILPSTNVIKVNTVYGNSNLAELEPRVISVKIMANTGETNSETTLGRLTYRYIYSSTTTDEDGTLIPISGNSITLNNSGEPLFIEFKYFHPNTNLLVDRERIPFVRDGVSGTFDETRYAKTGSFTEVPAVNKTNPEPPGWSKTPPQLNSSSEILYMIKCTKNHLGELIGEWSDPIRISGPAGPQGIPGPQGSPGQASELFIAPMGVWSPTRKYKGNPKRVEAVIYQNSWYVTRVDADATNGNEGIPVGTPPTNTNYWNKSQMNFDFIATGLFLAEAAYIENLMVRNLKTNDNLDSQRVEITEQSNSINFFTGLEEKRSSTDPTPKHSTISISAAPGIFGSSTDANTGSVTIRGSKNHTSYLSTEGIFSNIPRSAFFSISAAPGNAASVVGLTNDFHNYEKGNSDSLTLVAGVAGICNNNYTGKESTENGAVVGGLFNTVRLGGTFNNCLNILGNSQTPYAHKIHYTISRVIIGQRDSMRVICLPRLSRENWAYNCSYELEVYLLHSNNKHNIKFGVIKESSLNKDFNVSSFTDEDFDTNYVFDYIHSLGTRTQHHLGAITGVNGGVYKFIFSGTTLNNKSLWTVFKLS